MTIPIIGIAGVFSGPRSAYGALLRQRVLANPVPGADYRFSDEAADPDVAVAVAKQFVADGVKAVVGHFNSDCARRAGAVYRGAGVPLLLPAATADGLAREVQGFRFCAPDTRQIESIVQWSSFNGYGIAEAWTDGSPYADRLHRLAQARLLEFDDSATDGATLMFGAHYRIARELERRAQRGDSGPFVVCDDCAIGEFSRLIAHLRMEVYVAVPVPTFGDAVQAALETLRTVDLRMPPPEIRAALHILPRFADGEDHRNANFIIIEAGIVGEKNRRTDQ